MTVALCGSHAVCPMALNSMTLQTLLAPALHRLSVGAAIRTAPSRRNLHSKLPVRNANASAQALRREEEEDLEVQGTQEGGNERDFYLKVLSAAPSPREARAFLKKFSPAAPPVNAPTFPSLSLPRPPNSSTNHHPLLDDPERLSHLALVSIRAGLPRGDVESFANTLVHLQKLGLVPVVVVDPSEDLSQPSGTYNQVERTFREALRIATRVDRAGGRGMALRSGVFHTDAPTTSMDASRVSVNLPTIHTALRLGHIPIIAPTISSSTSVTLPLRTTTALTSLSRALVADTRTGDPARLVVVNGRGGVRTATGPKSLVNLEDDYRGVVAELETQARAVVPARANNVLLPQSPAGSQGDLAKSYPVDQLRDLRLVREVLPHLPPTSSAIITAAGASPALLYNILADRPMFSSSLPAPDGNLVVAAVEMHSSEVPTVIRRGVALEVHRSLDTLDLPKLQELLEASFGKPLLADGFWNRMRSVMDVTILAGDYVGASIMTREPWPLGVPIPASEPRDIVSGGHPGLVYLDKFAAHPRAQGSGVADALWRRMDKEYEQGWFWRSRSDNPVNKWYFDRSHGTFKLPGTHWTVFWHGGASDAVARMEAYAEVGRGIEASFGKPAAKLH